MRFLGRKRSFLELPETKIVQTRSAGHFTGAMLALDDFLADEMKVM